MTLLHRHALLLAVIASILVWSPASAAGDSSGPDRDRTDPATSPESGELVRDRGTLYWGNLFSLPEVTRASLPGAAWGSGYHGHSDAVTAGSADTDDKKQVPKKDKPRRRDRDDQEDERRTEDDEDEDDKSCVGSCMEGILLSMLFPSSDDDEDDEEESAQAEEAPHTDSFASQAQQPAHADTLQDGSAQGPPPPPVHVPIYERSAEESQTYVAEPQRPPRFALLGGLSYWKSWPSEIWDEYKGGAQGFLSSHLILGRSFQVNLDLRYGSTSGESKFDYETATRLESPDSTKLEIFSVSLRAGQYITLSEKGHRLHWGVGPTLAWVKGTAYLSVYSLPDMDFLKEREETLEKWRLGFDAALGLTFVTGPSGGQIGLMSQFFVIPWESEGEKSLTLDFIGRKSLVGFSIGLVVGYDGF